MRRVLGVFLCLLLVFLFTNLCIAEAQKDIVFFNIPWGSSATEISKNLHPEINFNFHEAVTALESAFDTQLGSLFTWDCSEYKNGVRGVKYWFDEPQYKVAGYDLYGLSIECMYDVVDGKIIKDPDHTKFYAGQYFIRNINSEAAYEDLQKKLNNQYGEGTEIERSSSKSYIRVEGVSYEAVKWKACSEWVGNNDTKILLVGTWLEKNVDWYEKASLDDILDDSHIYITYYLSNCDEAIREMDQIQKQEEIDAQQNSIDENNSDGL